jgi:type II secretory pathway pseudopilin PulG
MEAVVALAIVGALAAGAMASAGAHVRAADRAIRAIEGQALARERLALTRLLGGTAAVLPDSVARGVFPFPFADYTWTATAAPRFDEPDLRDVTVEVHWEGGRYALRTLLVRPPEPREEAR